MLIINQVLRLLNKSYERDVRPQEKKLREREVEDNERRVPSDGSVVALASVV